MARTRRSLQQKITMRRVAELDAERDTRDDGEPSASASIPQVQGRRIRRRFDSADNLSLVLPNTLGGDADFGLEDDAEASNPQASNSFQAHEAASLASELVPGEDNLESKRSEARRPQLFVALTAVSPECVDDDASDSEVASSPRLLPTPAPEPREEQPPSAEPAPRSSANGVEAVAASPAIEVTKQAPSLPHKPGSPVAGHHPSSKTIVAAQGSSRPAAEPSSRGGASPLAHRAERVLATGGERRERESNARARHDKPNDDSPETPELLPPTLEQVREDLLLTRHAATQAELSSRVLLDEVRAIGRRQNNYERKYVLNSVFAYVIFCALIFGGLYFVFDLRSAKNAADTDYYEAEFERITQRLSIAEAELERYRRASQHAFEIYQLIEQARYDEALLRFVEVQDQLINPAETAMLEARIDTLKWKMAEDAYRAGLSFFNNGEYEKARDAFFQSVAHQAETPYSHLLSYHLGTCLYELGDFEGARNYLKIALAARLPSDLDAEARYLYAVSTEKVGSLDEAYELYEAFLKRNRFHKHADDVTRRVGKLDKARTRTTSPSATP